METHKIMGGNLHVYKRENSDVWQCSTYLAGKNRRASTRQKDLAAARDAATDWYFNIKTKHKTGELESTGPTFKQAAEQFRREFEIITKGERNPDYVKGHWRRLSLHLEPFFGNMSLADITPGQVQEYRIKRHEETRAKTGKAPARNTLHQEIVCLRQVLKCAVRHRLLAYVPDLSEPYRSNGKITHRAWFSPEEYKQLYTATRERVEHPPKKRFLRDYEELHDFVLFMANTGLRPDEANRLQYRDVTIVDDARTGETILEIEVRGKRGVGYCKSMTGAVLPFRRMQKRAKPQPTDVIFAKDHHILFNNVLEELGLKFDREGQRRTAYSLRHTYICIRLMEGADIYQIAKNCRTSVEMIEKYYASHIKNRLDAAAINIRQPKAKKKRVRETEDA